MPHLFTDKQTFAVTIENAFVFEGDRVAVPFTYCEIYAPTAWMMKVHSRIIHHD